MQAVAEQQTSASTNKIDYHQIAEEYISRNLGDMFIVSPLGQMSSNSWWSLVLARLDGQERLKGVGRIQVDFATRGVVPLTPDEVRIMREKVTMVKAKNENKLPIGDNGFVVAEYARQQASRYLQAHLTMYYGAVEPVLVLEESALWQVTIQFKMVDIGPFTLGTMDVDADTGEAISLPNNEIIRIRERTRGIIRIQAPETTETI